MSQESHPKTDRAQPGSTPTEQTASRSEMEREQAERSSGTPPDQTVPDEVADEAARSEDPLADHGGVDAKEDDPLHRADSTSDVHGAPSGDV